MVLPPIDFDGLWKDALDLYLEEALALFFPDAHAAIDWSRGYQPIDKELQPLAPEGESGVQAVDKLAQVWLRDAVGAGNAEEIWVLIHIEVQSQTETLFAERMFRYHTRLYDQHRHRVASFAILGDERPGWRPDNFRYGLLGTDLRLTFPIAKLLDYDEAILEASTNPFATVVLAHRAAQATRHDAERRAVFKFNLTRRLYRLGHSRDEVVRLHRFIDWLLRLPPELEDRVMQQIKGFEEEQAVSYMSYPERVGHAQGVIEGRAEGWIESIATALEVKFGAAGLVLIPEIRQIVEPDRLRVILARCMTASSPEEVRAVYADVK
ncbi:MAG: cytosolic protein [Chloroflexia bacterium]